MTYQTEVEYNNEKLNVEIYKGDGETIIEGLYDAKGVDVYDFYVDDFGDIIEAIEDQAKDEYECYLAEQERDRRESRRY